LFDWSLPWTKVPSRHCPGPFLVTGAAFEDVRMTNVQDPAAAARDARERTGRVLGWLSGLGLLVVPWIAAGLLATIATMVGPGSWDAEHTFPWLLLGSLVGCLVWVTYGSVRISGFRRGALPGAAIALVVVGAIYLLGVVLQS
jgi:hypothetical protein